MNTAQVVSIPLGDLVPWDNGGRGQPRKHFDPQALQELADSIRAAGFIGAIEVRPAPGQPGKYEVLGGHRRTRAAAMAGLDAIPATVHELDDRAARLFVLLDNLNRQDFLPWEEGAGYAELLQDGMTLAQVAGQAGRSTAFVAGRVKLSQTLGDPARESYLQKAFGVEVLALLADLPDRDLSPVACPKCNRVNPEGATACGSCRADLSGEMVWPAGNPQAAAVKLCRGCSAAVAAEKVARVKDAYGLGEAPVQTSLGFDDVQVSQGAVAVKSALERKLGEVGDLQGWVLKHLPELEQYTPDTRRAIADQCAAAIRVFRQVAEAVGVPVAV